MDIDWDLGNVFKHYMLYCIYSFCILANTLSVELADFKIFLIDHCFGNSCCKQHLLFVILGENVLQQYMLFEVKINMGQIESKDKIMNVYYILLFFIVQYFLRDFCRHIRNITLTQLLVSIRYMHIICLL